MRMTFCHKRICSVLSLSHDTTTKPAEPDSHRLEGFDPGLQPQIQEVNHSILKDFWEMGIMMILFDPSNLYETMFTDERGDLRLCRTLLAS